MVQACANVGARKTGQNGRSNASGIIVVTDAPSAPVGIVVIVSWWQKAVQAPTTPASPSAMVDQTVATAPDACASRISQPLTTVATASAHCSRCPLALPVATTDVTAPTKAQAGTACKKLCNLNDKKWRTKCTWLTCSGCAECSGEFICALSSDKYKINCNKECALRDYQWKQLPIAPFIRILNMAASYCRHHSSMQSLACA